MYCPQYSFTPVTVTFLPSVCYVYLSIFFYISRHMCVCVCVCVCVKY